ncbi:hypothetical protein ACQEV9_00025 [Streptomyces chartreusis]|uniref:hypothetical protein n=1 Tax=Streptomyces chartreusis TaxID=1969 RepID=UPI003D8FFD7C
MGLLLMMLARQLTRPDSPSQIDGTLPRRLDHSTARARYWVKRTPTEALRLLHRTRVYHLAAASLSTLTALLAWPLIADTSPLAAQIVLSTLSCLTAAAIAAPYATRLHDRAEEAIKLCGAYGAIYGELLSAQSRLDPSTTPQPPVGELIQRLDDVTACKDALKLAPPPPDSSRAFGDSTEPAQ